MAEFWNNIVNWIKNYFYSLFGLDLLLKAVRDGTPIPAQAG